MIEYDKYATLKSKNLVSFRLLKPGVVEVSTDKFDDLGNKTTSTTNVTVGDVVQEVADEQAYLAAMQSYLSDLQAAK